MAKNLHDSLLFENIDAKYVDEFLKTLPEPISLHKNDYLWRQGDSGHSMFLIESGKLEVLIFSQKDHADVTIATLESGALLGEVCVFGEKTRSASIRVLEDSQLLNIDGEKFLQKVQEQDIGVLLMCYNISKLLTQRLLIANEFIKKIHLMLADKSIPKSEIERYRNQFLHESLFN